MAVEYPRRLVRWNRLILGFGSTVGMLKAHVESFLAGSGGGASERMVARYINTRHATRTGHTPDQRRERKSLLPAKANV